MSSHIIWCPWISSSLGQLTYPQSNATVVFNGQRSTRLALDCGVPQGSVLGPILFLLHTADVTAIAEYHRLGARFYADDIQLSVHFKPASNHEWSAHIALCIEEIEKWMTSNLPKLNMDKTQFIWFGTRQQLAKVQCQTVTLGTSSIPISAEDTCMEVVLDSELKFDTHIKRLSGRSFDQLRRLGTIRRTVTVNAAN